MDLGTEVIKFISLALAGCCICMRVSISNYDESLAKNGAKCGELSAITVKLTPHNRYLIMSRRSRLSEYQHPL